MKSIPTMMDMTWEEVDRLVKENALVLMAVGIIEEHGPHLPLSTDLDLAMAQAEDVRQELECMGRKSVIAPPFFWGGAQALTRQFPGTFTSRAETIAECMYEILESLSRFGFRDVVLFNCHGDQLHRRGMVMAMERALETLEIHPWWPVYEDDLEWTGFSGEEPYLLLMPPYPGEKMFRCQRPPRDSFDVHAGAYETAGMIEKYPEKVRREKMEGLLPTCLHDEQIGKWVQGEKQDRPLIPKGYCGDPAGALWMETDMTTADRVMARDIVSFLQKRNRME